MRLDPLLLALCSVIPPDLIAVQNTDLPDSLQAAMLEERLKTLDFEKLQEQIEEDILVDKECERLDVQAREAQYRQEQAIKARELLAKQVESRRHLKSV